VRDGLRCERGDEQLHVEVKGTQSEFIIIVREVRNAMIDRRHLSDRFRPDGASLESTTCLNEPTEKRSHNEKSGILMRAWIPTRESESPPELLAFADFANSRMPRFMLGSRREGRLAIRAARFVCEADFPRRAGGEQPKPEEFGKFEKNERALREQ